MLRGQVVSEVIAGDTDQQLLPGATEGSMWVWWGGGCRAGPAGTVMCGPGTKEEAAKEPKQEQPEVRGRVGGEEAAGEPLSAAWQWQRPGYGPAEGANGRWQQGNTESR